jgi:raffinose/stachyose/melibiose transport system substrate-binding protein
MKKLVTFVLMSCFFLSVWTGFSEAEEQNVKLHIFHFKVSQIEQWDTLTAKYEKRYPHVDLDVEIVGGGSDWQTVLKTKFASGKGPDIFVVDGPALAKTFQDYLTDLSNEPWVEHVVESAKAPMTWDGKLMGMPMNLEGYGFIYNKALFKKAGIEKKSTTFSELRAAAEKLKQAGITPFGNAYAEWWVIGMHLMNIPFALQDDPEAFLAALNDGTQTIPDNPIFQDFQKLFDLTIQYSNPNSLTTDHNAQMALFTMGEAAMAQQGNWKEVGIYEANPDAEVGLLPFALNDDPGFSDRLPVGVPFYWIVNNQSEYVEEAKTFLDWLVSSDTGKHYITDEFGYIPAYDNISADSLGGLSQDILEYASQGKTIPWVFTKWSNGMYNEFAAHTQSYVAGKMTYAQMLENMQQSWDKLK